MNNDDFNYQWGNIPSKNIEYNEKRVREFLKLTKLPKRFFKNKKCLDAGCGNGRYTFAMMKLGCEVTSYDISENAVKLCRDINKDTHVQNIFTLKNNSIYDFVLSWGVIHHTPDPQRAFYKLASQVKSGGILHIMVYHRDIQSIYRPGRHIWSKLNTEQKIKYCADMVKRSGGDIHGWWDALNPKYNFSYTPNEIKKWFECCGFTKIKLTQKYNINMRGQFK